MIYDWRYSISDTCPTPGGCEVETDQKSHIKKEFCVEMMICDWR
jgi:hypothetical protein